VTRAAPNGAFRIDGKLCEPQLNRVSSPASATQLEPKVMQVLVMLAEAGGEPVPRERLLESVWAGTFVGEQVLSRAVSELRKAFGDDARSPRVIETIAKKGYRLISPVEPALPEEPRGRIAGIAGAVVLGLAVVALLSWWLRSESPNNDSEAPTPIIATNLAVVLPESAPIELSYFQSFALSGDGSRVVYTGHVDGQRRLYMRSLDRREVTPLAGSEGGYGPFFSPDSESIGFYALGELHTMSLADGSVRMLVRDTPDAQGASWGPDGTIVFARRILEGLFKVSAEGGKAERLTTLDRAAGEVSHFWPQILPDGKHALFTVWRGAGSRRSAIDVVEIETGERRRVMEGASFPRYMPTGELVILSGSKLYAIDFDIETHQISGDPRMVLEDPVTYPFSGIAHFALAPNGTLVYASRSDFSASWSLSWIDADGNRRAAIDARLPYSIPRLSPDGTRVATTLGSGSMEVWVHDLARQDAEQLTEGGQNMWPIWTPDGKQIVFSSDRNGPFNLYVASVSEDIAPRRLTRSSQIQFPGCVTPDGTRVIYSELHPDTRFDIWSVPLDGSALPEPLLNSRDDEFRPALSPDGRLLAYASNESERWDERGRWDVYVRPLDSLSTRIKISTDGGGDPTWSHDGSRLFYRRGAQLLSVEISTEPALSAGAPHLEHDGIDPPNPVTQVPHYDVAADGRFLVVDRSSQGDATQLNVVLNWLGREY